MLASRGAENSVIKIERTQLSDGSTPEAETRSTSPSLVELWRRPGRCELDWVCGKTEMTEDSADCAREHDGGHETQAPAAVRALEHIDVETAPHELGPGAIVGSGDLLRGGCGRCALNPGTAEVNDLATPLRVRCEHAVIDDEVHVGARTQGGELFELS